MFVKCDTLNSMKTSWLRKYGFTLEEIGKQMKMTRAGVLYHVHSNPERVKAAVSKMREKAWKGFVKIKEVAK